MEEGGGGWLDWVECVGVGSGSGSGRGEGGSD